MDSFYKDLFVDTGHYFPRPTTGASCYLYFLGDFFFSSVKKRFVYGSMMDALLLMMIIIFIMMVLLLETWLRATSYLILSEKLESITAR